ncbi:MAG TPA: hypothetical protein VIU12_14835 [Chryseolinea sp.]
MQLFHVISFARSNFTKLAKTIKNERSYKDFDFASLTPSINPNPTVRSVKLFYNDNDELIGLRSQSKFKDSDFEYQFIQNQKHEFTISFAKQIFDTEYENEQGDIVHGFFLSIHSRCFFIGFNEPLCIMELDRDLRAVKTLRFKLNHLNNGTKVNYKERYHIYSDSLYKPDHPFELTKETTISDIMDEFDSMNSNFTFDKELRIGWVKEEDHLPLWIFGGLHEYDYSQSEK